MITGRPALSRAIKQSLFAMGYYGRRLSHVAFPGVAVLCYHGIRRADEATPFNELHVTRDTFERHCELITKSCNPISLDDFRAARAGTRPLPPRAVMVTFDDGYRGVLDYGLPSLERHGVPAVVFICAGPVLGSRHFWFDALWSREGEAAVLNAREARFAEWRTLITSIDKPADPGEQHRPLTVEELRRLAASPLIEIGGHTLSHPTLALAPAEEQRREIRGCRETLQDAINAPVDAFAYPYGGLRQDYLPETAGIAREAGFTSAFTTGESFATLDGDPFQIPRFVMLESVGDVELAHRLLHSWRASGEPA